MTNLKPGPVTADLVPLLTAGRSVLRVIDGGENSGLSNGDVVTFDFDSWDFRSGDRVRITREAKATATRNSGDEG